jgi:hypothetical protein
MASLAGPWNMETRGQDTVTTWVGGTAPWEYITLHIGVIMTLNFNLPLLVPRTPAGLASWLIIYGVLRTLGQSQHGFPNNSQLLERPRQVRLIPLPLRRSIRNLFSRRGRQHASTEGSPCWV